MAKCIPATGHRGLLPRQKIARFREFVGGLSQHHATRGKLCSHIQRHARGIGHRRDRTQSLHVCRGDPIAVSVENLRCATHVADHIATPAVRAVNRRVHQDVVIAPGVRTDPNNDVRVVVVDHRIGRSQQHVGAPNVRVGVAFDDNIADVLGEHAVGRDPG